MSKHLIGVISDTHGLLWPQAVKALGGAELIIHAGDLGGPEVLAALERLAPVQAVRGNVDKGEWAKELPLSRVVEVGDLKLYILHELFTLDLDPAAAGLAAVIFGHSHRPHQERRDGVLYLNPGSAGPRRFTLPVTLAMLTVEGNGLAGEFIRLLK
jgi:putative phosphoesterase